MIKIEKMHVDNVALLNSFESELRIYGSLDVTFVKGSFSYRVVADRDANEALMKVYEEQDVDFSAYLNEASKCVYFAFLEGEVVGQIVLSTRWNGYGFIDDVRVKRGFKGRGIGKALIDQAKGWCQSHQPEGWCQSQQLDGRHQLGGLMLETQSNNIDACLFYEKMGFEIGGLDRLMYRQFDKVSNEIALYWYWLKPGTK